MVKHVKFHLNRFLRRVRIHGGEFDTSARAMYRVSEKGSLISYEKAFSTQAEPRIVRGSTIERKQMSTKTTFKRIALVTVAALGFGVLSVAPSSANNANLFVKVADGVSAGTASTAGNGVGGGIAGPFNNVTLGLVQFGNGDVVELTGGTFASASAGTLNTARTVLVSNGNADLVVATPTAGTITARLFRNTAGVVATTAAETVVITVGATALSGVYSASLTTSFIVAGETLTAAAGAAIAADATVSAAKTLSPDTATATIVVNYRDGLGKSMVGTGDTLTATIVSGPGTITTSSIDATVGGRVVTTFDSTTARSATGAAGTRSTVLAADNTYTASVRPETVTGLAAFYVFPNNQAGVTRVEIKNAAGTVVATKSLTFTDTTIATIEATVLKPTVNGDSGAHTTNVIRLVFKDTAGAVITAPAAYPTATSSATTIAAAAQTGNGGSNGWDTATATGGFVLWGVDPVGEKYGDVTFTFTAGLVKATATVKIVSKVATTVKATAAAATAGDKITYTITATDSTGAAIPEGSPLTDYVASVATTGGISAEPTIASTNLSVAGSWTVTGTAPLISTTLKSVFTLAGTAGTATTSLSKALAGTKLDSVDVAVSNPASDAAIAAAELAEAAAQDATDAALDATEAATLAGALAQEAVDAVADLSTQVATLIAALKKQITTLTNLVIKIQKKVRA
jgi:trimeric autotransporter adhesin